MKGKVWKDFNTSNLEHAHSGRIKRRSAMKQILTFILTLTMAFSFCVNSFAATTTATASETQTDTSKTQAASSETQADTSKTQAASSETQAASPKAPAGTSYGISNLSGAPDIVAESAVIMDANSGAVLYGKEA